MRPLEPGEFDRRGRETGRVWRAHIARTLSFAGSGRYFRSEGENEVVLLHELPKEELYYDDILCARRAIEIYRRPEIRAASTIRQLIDVSESEYVLVLVYEWAEQALHEALAAGPVTGDNAGNIVANVGAALTVLHGLDLVHCDVAPNNVLQVGDAWKLADLNSCVARGESVSRFPPERYRHPDAVPGAPADPRFDFYGLEQIAERLKARGESG